MPMQPDPNRDGTMQIGPDHPVVRSVMAQHPGYDLDAVVTATRGVIEQLEPEQPNLGEILVADQRRATHHEAVDELDDLGFDGLGIFGQHNFEERDFAIAASGLTLDEVLERHPEIGAHRARRAIGLRTPLRGLDHKIALEADRTSVTRTANRYSMAYNTVLWYLRRLRYHALHSSVCMLILLFVI